jgi:GTP pyrophosphokinase
MAEPQPSVASPAAGGPPPDPRFAELMAKVQRYRPGENLELLQRAYDFAARQHQAQRRASGEPYLSHPLAVSHLLADMGMDVTTICVGLLHDVMEDTRAEPAVVEREFGGHVARLVEGLTKINRLDFFNPEVRQAENLRKMLLAMVDDVRVILIKLADRLHNMRTLEYLPPETRDRVARETLDIYAPIAHRLGMGRVRGELEDLAFRTLEAENYARIRQQLEEKRSLNERFLDEVKQKIAAALRENDIPAELEGRIKRPFSIHQKMQRQGVGLDQIYDLLAVRVVTDSVKNCYAALGVIHQLWRPVPGRFKDYIAMARPNLYQSLHTSLITAGQPFEVQVRTREMHRLAERGIAAHWAYKDSEAVTAEDQQRITWLRHLIEWAREMQDPSEFLSTLKVDLYPEEVYAFTPKGKVIVLPRQASPVDFAYAIHTEVGNTCTGAKVNGRMVPLRHRLQNGDIVEILTQAGRSPNRDWLSFVRTSKARNKVQHWIRLQQRTQAAELGRRLLEKVARRYRVNLKQVTEEDLLRVAREHGCQRVDELYARVGFGKYAPRHLLSRLSREPLPETRPAARGLGKLKETVQRVFRLQEKALAMGERDLLMYRARCCNPVRGEAVVGYITRGRGVAVHAQACPNVQNLLYDVERRIRVNWAEGGEDTYPVRVAIRASDRPGLLTQMSGIISSHNSNISSADARTDPADASAVIDLTFEVTEMKQLERILAALKKINGVRDVTRRLRF